MEESVCDAFQKNPDGSWTSTRAVLLSVGVTKIDIPEGMTFIKGELFMFIDVAGWLDEHCS